MADAIPTKSRELVKARDGGLCVRCGMLGREVHHRRRRRINFDGLAHSPANLIRLCGWGNNTGCHGWTHAHPVEARELGLTLRPDDDPRLVPMAYVRRGLVLLDGDGGIAVV